MSRAKKEVVGEPPEDSRRNGVAGGEAMAVGELIKRVQAREVDGQILEVARAMLSPALERQSANEDRSKTKTPKPKPTVSYTTL